MGAADLRAFLVIYGAGHGVWWPVMAAFTVLGSGWSALALFPMAWHAPTRRFAAGLTAAIAVQALLVWSVKRAVGRVRPWIALALPAPIGAPHDPSFPSGHAAGSFCVAAFVALALPAAHPDSPRACRVVALAAAVAAPLVGVSRVYLGAHFPGDVLAGAILGVSVGVVAAGAYARSEGRRAADRATWQTAKTGALVPPTEKG